MNRPIGLLFVLLCLGLAGPASAGIYSGISGVTPGAIDNPIARSQLLAFESRVVSYDPAPGVGAGFRSPTTGLASLGELYSPVLNPNGTNVPFDRNYQPAVGTEPNSFHNGSASFSPFGGDIRSTSDTYGFIGIDRPGSITLGFDTPITDGAGADFAVFENGFGFGGANSLLAELAYVEVSSNGTDFARFASISLNTAPTTVSGAFQGYDMTNVYNLAGKHASGWGTPFDLSQLGNDALVAAGLLDLSRISYVRLVDVVGSGPLFDPTGAAVQGIARDSLGNPILDNWVTYDSAGFDYLGLNVGAVGVINAVPEPGTWLLCSAGMAAVGLASRRVRTRSAAPR
ncbi:PEP-CTERM sorting domain-containing protein [Tundrisphaera sp. TA3]|uniref:PEP-CTERM sorting domain-containing protein n=1 Tax=Tundrisphaera sp. TA3 TaxID=3435775 RepID=UPI003EB8565E